MTRGNQRESDREKAQKKLAGQNKPKESASSLKKRQEENGEIMRLKQKASADKKAAEAAGGIAVPATAVKK